LNQAEISIASDHPAGPGHFPGHPIVPGAVLLSEIAHAVGLGCRGVVSAKFLHPVRPGETLSLTWQDATADTVRFAASVAGRAVVTGVLRLGPR